MVDCCCRASQIKRFWISVKVGDKTDKHGAGYSLPASKFDEPSKLLLIFTKGVANYPRKSRVNYKNTIIF